MISARTKAALQAAKRRGVKLGGDRGARFTAKHVKAAVAARREKARARAVADLASVVKELQAAGCASLRAIAAGLEERGIPAVRGQVVCRAGLKAVGGSRRPFRGKRRRRRVKR